MDSNEKENKLIPKINKKISDFSLSIKLFSLSYKDDSSDVFHTESMIVITICFCVC